jgi:UrcA family protein
MNRIATLLLVSVLASLNHSANADPAPQVSVRFTDLDLTRTEGAAALYQRLQRAAASVCGSADTKDLPGVTRVHACIRTAIDEAVAKVDQPTLTAYYRNRNPVGSVPEQVAAR